MDGEKLLNEAIENDIETGDSQESFTNKLFDLLSTDTLPRAKPGEDFQTQSRQLRNSIFIPPVGGSSIESKPADEVAAADESTVINDGSNNVGEGAYGTHQQTVILVDIEGRVTFVERTLYDTHGQPAVGEEHEKKFEFQIEGW